LHPPAHFNKAFHIEKLIVTEFARNSFHTASRLDTPRFRHNSNQTPPIFRNETLLKIQPAMQMTAPKTNSNHDGFGPAERIGTKPSAATKTPATNKMTPQIRKAVATNLVIACLVA
jgi:hypothetical protein